MKASLFAALFSIQAFVLKADEGMWLFNQPPRQILHDRHQFDATDAWLDHLQKSSVRFDSGGSGSFVSADGLIISNYHVGADALQKLSTKEKNYLRDGFYASTPAEELKCLDLELNVLQSIEDVTARVNAAVPTGTNADEAFLARRKIIADIEKESLDRTGLPRTSSHFGKAARIISTGINATRTCGLYLRQSNRVLCLAATRIISSIRATTWTSAFFAPMKATSQSR
jgi:Peptidase S46